MTAAGWGAQDKIAKAGDSATGTIVFDGTPPIQIPAGAAAGDVLTSDASGNASWTAAASTVTAAIALETSRAEGAEASLASIAGDLGGAPSAPQVVSTHLAVTTISGATGTVNLDPTSTGVFAVTETGSTTFTFTSGTGLTSGTAYSFTLYLSQDATGGRVTTWPGSVTWVGGTIPTLVTTASALNVLVFESLNGGTTWYGSLITAPALPLPVASGGTAATTSGAALTNLGVTAAIAASAATLAPIAGVSGVFSVGGKLTLSGGTSTAGSAPLLTPTFASGTAAQLSDTTRDYEIYLQIGTAGTAFSVAIGPTSTPADTIYASATPPAGALITFRCPAAWFVKWAGTSTTLASQKAIGC
jgi:hypothetical protein